MNGPDELRQENAALREHISRLNAAILRINDSPDLNTVLNEAAGSARALTGAGFGVIATVDGRGALEELLSAGLTPDEHRQVAEWPHACEFFGHLRGLSGVLRAADLGRYTRALGYAVDPTLSKTLLATPMCHRGMHVGCFLLGEKQGGKEFGREDEALLALFASQAATAIANARMHRDEHRARADLEALIDTAPVGVVVLNAKTGRPVSYNRAARRLVRGLCNPDDSVEQLLEVMVCRRSDGHELALDEASLALLLGSTTPVRAEEVELSVPDGRSVRTLLNVIPIQPASGTVESVVVTMQDLAPLKQLERLQAEFLSMVSHELRAPLTSIKGSAAIVLSAGADLGRAEMREFFRIINEQADHMRGLIGDLLDAGRIDAGTLSVSPEASEVADLVEQARNTFLSGGGRQLMIDLPPDLPHVMADRRRIVQVLNNLFSNAARHAPESSPIRVAAVRDATHVAISVADDGPGVAPERMPHLFRKHAGIAGGDREGALGTAGLGLAICKGLVEAHGGRIRAASGGAGQGTQVTFTLPAADGAAHSAGRNPPADPVNPPQTPILVVDDDPQTLRYVRDALTGSSYTTLVTGDPTELSPLIRTKKPRLVLLDLLLPMADGIELMKSVPELADVPVIFISGYGRDETIARALEAGAADYIVKPFSPTELRARIRAALRRHADPEFYHLGDLTIDYDRRRVSVAGQPVHLTATEFELLRVISTNEGRVLTYESLLRRVWNDPYGSDSDLVRTFVSKLRRKLGDDAVNPAYIVNERAIGYRMARPSERDT